MALKSHVKRVLLTAEFLIVSGLLFSQQIVTKVLDASSCSQEITVAVTVENLNNVAAISLVINYDPGVLSYSGYQDKNSALNGGFFFVNGGNGSVVFSWVSLNAVSIGNDTLIRYNFTSAGGVSDLAWDTFTSGNCEYSDFNGQQIPAIFIDGMAAVSQPDLTVFAGNDLTLVAGDCVELSALVSGGIDPYTFQWNSNQTTQSIYVSPKETTMYQLIVSDSLLCFANDEILVTVLPSPKQQTIELNSGWNSLSGYINPSNPGLDCLLVDIAEQAIIMVDLNGNYFLSGNLSNNLVDWNISEGYYLKANQRCELVVYGDELPDKTVQLSEGWNLLPVLSECEVSVEELFAGINVQIVVSGIGTSIFWPEYGINSLEYLFPGNAYKVMMSNADSVTFPDCFTIK